MPVQGGVYGGSRQRVLPVTGAGGRAGGSLANCCSARLGQRRSLQQRGQCSQQLSGGGPLLWPLRDAAVVEVHHLQKGEGKAEEDTGEVQG